MPMTPTEVRNGNISFGDAKGKFVDFVIGTYATGGLAVSPNSFGLHSLLACFPVGGNAAAGGYVFIYDTVNKKIVAYQSATLTPAGTVAAPTFTGSALAAHRHSLFVATGATDATGARVNAATNSLAMNNAAATVAGIAAASGSAGGVVDVTGGTPAGTNSAPAFTGTATTAAALAEVGNGVDLSAITVRLLGIGLG